MSGVNDIVLRELKLWLGRYQKTAESSRVKITISHFLNGRVLMVARWGMWQQQQLSGVDTGRLVHFGISYYTDGSYPSTEAAFYSDWSGACRDFYSCKLSEAMINNSTSNHKTVSDILTAVSSELLSWQYVENEADNYQNIVGEGNQYFDIEGDILQKFYSGENVGVTISTTLDVWSITVGSSGVRIMVDVQGIRGREGPKIWIAYPYFNTDEDRPILSSGLVVLPGLTPATWNYEENTDLIARLVDLSETLGSPDEGFYETDLIDVHYRNLSKTVVKDNKASHSVKIIGGSQPYVCGIQKSLYDRLIDEDNKFPILELTNSIGLRTVCAFAPISSDRFSSDMIISREIARDLLLETIKNKRLTIRLIHAKTASEIDVRYKKASTQEQMNAAIRRHNVLMEGMSLRLDDGEEIGVVVKTDPSPYCATLRLTDQDSSTTISYYRPYSHYDRGDSLQPSQLAIVKRRLSSK
jgi:hypothetical protein